MPKQLAVPHGNEEALTELGEQRQDARAEWRIIAVRGVHGRTTA